MTAARTSLSTMTGVPSKAALTRGPRGTSSTKPGTLRAWDTWPVVTSTEPGDPMAMAPSADGANPASSTALRTLATISATTSSALVLGVRWRDCPTTSPADTTTDWIFVPPRSTPAIACVIVMGPPAS